MRAVVRIAVVGVRRRNHVRDAIGHCSLADLDANIPALGPIIDVGENVGMNIDHGDKNYAENQAPLFKLTLDLNRFAEKEKGARRLPTEGSAHKMPAIMLKYEYMRFGPQ